MKISIAGYGRMGKSIEQIALQRKHTINAVVDKSEDWISYEEKIRASDVLIEFSMPDTVVENIKKCFALSVPVVVGTTGWDDARHEIVNLCKDGGHSLFYASNFSVGMNIFMAANEYLACLMNAFDDYDLRIEETHHIHKKDMPSGTAISLADQIIAKVERKNKWVCNREEACGELRIDAHRFDEVPGLHEVFYDSKADEIKFSHRAKNRDGFAKGAVMAAEWLPGKNGVFSMKDMLFS